MEVFKMKTTITDENVYIYFDTETKEAVVIDPGNEADVIIEFINKNKLKVQAILLTHGHFDHIGAVEEIKDYTGALTYCHELEKDLIENPNLNLSKRMVGKEISVKVDKFFKDGDIFEFGPTYLKVIHTPGHTTGGICLYDENRNLLFTGDSLFKNSIGRTDFPGGNKDELVNSLKTKILVLPKDTIIFPGHNVNSTIEEEMASNPYLK